MMYDPQKHHRKSICLRDYDYSQEGWYFVTIIVQNRDHLFGEINNGKVELNPIGRIVEYRWKQLARHISHIEIDEYVTMPNHIHGITQTYLKDTPCLKENWKKDERKYASKI